MKMNKATEIENCFAKQEITKKERDALHNHNQHHTTAHMRKMLDLMKEGKIETLFSQVSPGQWR